MCINGRVLECWPQYLLDVRDMKLGNFIRVKEESNVFKFRKDCTAAQIFKVEKSHDVDFLYDSELEEGN